MRSLQKTLLVLIALIALAGVRTRADSPDETARAKAGLVAWASLAESDPELANHFGLFKTKPVGVQNYGGKLVVAANIINSVTGLKTSPDELNALASKEKLFSENAYGASVALDSKAMCRLLTLGSRGRFVVSLAHRVEGRVPVDEAREAEASPELFVIIAYLDHTPMIESAFSWAGANIEKVCVINPLAGLEGAVPFKARSEYDPKSIDVWEFYRFRKSIQ